MSKSYVINENDTQSMLVGTELSQMVNNNACFYFPNNESSTEHLKLIENRLANFACLSGKYVQ